MYVRFPTHFLQSRQVRKSFCPWYFNIASRNLHNCCLCLAWVCLLDKYYWGSGHVNANLGSAPATTGRSFALPEVCVGLHHGSHEFYYSRSFCVQAYIIIVVFYYSRSFLCVGLHHGSQEFYSNRSFCVDTKFLPFTRTAFVGAGSTKSKSLNTCEGVLGSVADISHSLVKCCNNAYCQQS